VKGKMLDEIRAASHSGMALGNIRFKQDLETLTGRQLHKLPQGGKPRNR
jgi:putative transposase